MMKAAAAVSVVVLLVALTFPGAGSSTRQAEPPSTDHEALSQLRAPEKRTERALKRLLPEVGIRNVFAECSARTSRTVCHFSIAHKYSLSPECGKSKVPDRAGRPVFLQLRYCD